MERWRKFWTAVGEWVGIHITHTRHEGCGGEWVEVGTSGWAVIRIHFECERCHAHSCVLMEH